MPDEKVMYIAKLQDGTLVEIHKEKGLHRAYNSAGVQVGLPFVDLSNLLKDLRAELVPAETEKPADETEKPAAETDAASLTRRILPSVPPDAEK